MSLRPLIAIWATAGVDTPEGQKAEVRSASRYTRQNLMYRRGRSLRDLWRLGDAKGDAASSPYDIEAVGPGTGATTAHAAQERRESMRAIAFACTGTRIADGLSVALRERRYRSIEVAAIQDAT